MAKKKLKTQEKKTISLTYTGIVQSPIKDDADTLDILMRKFESGKRYLRERIFEDLKRKEAVEMAKEKFIPNSRYMRDSFLEAEANISSLKENLPRYVEQNKLKIKSIEKSIEKIKEQIDKLTKREKFKQVEKKEQYILYKKNKIKKLTKQMNYFQHHIDNNSVPKVIDGSKKLLDRLNKGKVDKSEWREARSNNVYSRGEKSKGGNENIKLSFLKNDLFSMSILNPLSGKRGDRIHFIVRFPIKMVQTVASYLATGEAYSVRIKRQKGKYLVHVTLENDIVAKPNFKNGIAGMDINPDNLSVSIVHPNGNFKTSKVFWMYKINTVRADERDTIVQNALYEVLRWIKSFGIDTLVIEDLNFLQSNKGKIFNRMSHNFSYSNILKSLFSIAFKENIALLQVDAYYSSFIGKVKYQQMYGLSIHQAAAFVLARRGMGLKEKMPKSILPVLFAKEVKKGQEVSDLFKHWKKAKNWFDKITLEFKKEKIKTKGLLFSQIINLRKEEDVDLIFSEYASVTK